jgi:hypothetical protein
MALRVRVSPKKLRDSVKRWSMYVPHQGKNACCVAFVGRMTYEEMSAILILEVLRTHTARPWRKLQYDAFSGSQIDETNSLPAVTSLGPID